MRSMLTFPSVCVPERKSGHYKLTNIDSWQPAIVVVKFLQVIQIHFNTSNRWSGSNVGNVLTESPGSWDPGRKRTVKWSAEGAVKEGAFFEYSATQGARQTPGVCWYPAWVCVVSDTQNRVAPRVYPSLAENFHVSLSGLFYIRTFAYRALHVMFQMVKIGKNRGDIRESVIMLKDGYLCVVGPSPC